MIGVVKSALKKSLHLSALTLEELQTNLPSVEGVINRRPLTYVSDQPDSLAPLTPAHFLRLPTVMLEPWKDVSGRALSARWRQWKARSDSLLDRWRREYLSTLRTWKSAGSKSKLKPHVGDVVLVQEGPRRNTWPLAIVVKVISPHVNLVKIRNTITRRSTCHLYPLEMEVPWTSFPPLAVPDVAPPPIDELEEARDRQTVQCTRSGRAVKKPSRLGVDS